METEDQNNKIAATGFNSQPPPVSLPPTTIPTYPVMIMEAIEKLNDKDGSNKSTISKQIESTYGTLPPAHSTLLTHHLNKMKQMGQLKMAKNNYFKPDPNAPPPRGRGRPPKPKPALPEGYVPPPPRPRGRPPKEHDPLAPPPPPKVNAPNLSGRKRGRPPKAGKVASTEAVSPMPTGTPRGRGRPPKVKAAVTASVGA